MELSPEIYEKILKVKVAYASYKATREVAAVQKRAYREMRQLLSPEDRAELRRIERSNRK